jgi:beta-galactosidase/beta-glucuronidase
MKKLSVLLCALAAATSLQAQWKPAGDKIKTPWAEQVNPANVLPEYPRPLIERGEWANLNGLWEYAVTPLGAPEPATFEGQILVPFAIESSLSGVQKEVGEENELWYKREFTVPASWKNHVVLNFGAVDWKADVFVNDVLIGSHQGGYTPFSFDVTPFLKGKSRHKLVVRVWDPTDRGPQPRGKQVKNPESIWYTPVTGIWQTVWIEPVAPNHITAIKTIPDVDRSAIRVTVSTANPQSPDIVEVKLLDHGRVIASAKGLQGKELRLHVANPVLWTPDSPNLYDMKASLSSPSGTVVDEVKSYAAMRKISVKRDSRGVMRMQLNDRDLFHYGPLDQGWWPDGLYTAPTDEALLFDIKKTKEWGFNMIRKHVKVEPARWYYHCDREGILVWQDMPSGDLGNRWEPEKYNGGSDKDRSAASIAAYHDEWKEIVDFCISNPSVVVWVPFNEGWGQFDTRKVAEWTKTYDPSRLVNPASGGNHSPVGDILDLHNYPGPKMYLFDAERVNVLGEYGGIGLPLEEHLWWQKRNWGYVQFKSSDEVTDQYVKYADELKALVKQGFSAAVYTQTTDVEGEVNGLMTYDRKKVKINEAAIRHANMEVIRELVP